MGLTTDGGKVLTTRDAEADQQNWRRENGQGRDGRFVHAMPEWLVKLQEKKVHIINVGPWAWENWCGSYGKLTVAAHRPELFGTDDCPAWQHEEYAEMLVYDPNANRGKGDWIPPICAVMAENVIKNEAEMERQTEDGYKFAQEFLGIGRGQNVAYSALHKGLLVIKGERPTSSEIEQAKEALKTECMRLVQEARDLSRDPNPLARQAIVKGVHDEAAMILGLEDEDWMVARNPEARKSCRLCGTKVDDSVLKCPNCPYIFDPVAYGEIMAEQDAQIDKARNKGRKPSGNAQG